MGAGLALCQTVYNLNVGNYNKMLDTGIRGNAGHVLVQHALWQDDPEVEHVVQGSSGILAELSAATSWMLAKPVSF